MSVTQLTQEQISAEIMNDSLFRQALINGNFDIWQRGTSISLSDAAFIHLSDRWVDYHADDGGTLPTLTRSREVLSGEIDGSYYYTRLTTNGAGTSLGNNAVGQLGQNIEYGTRYLCGDGKKVTLSFWARSSIANKKVGVRAIQNYGTGGSPTSSEVINGMNWTLTSTWTKYTFTFTTNTLSGKTFGTANDDSLQIFLTYMWGSTRQAQYAADGAETYRGAGTIDIAQVQLNIGEEMLPFCPKGYADELRLCQRYCYVIAFPNTAYFTTGVCRSTTLVQAPISTPVEMRLDQPTVTLSGTFGARDSATHTVSAVQYPLKSGCTLDLQFVTAGLTIGYAGCMYGSAGAKLLIEAEL